MCSGVTSISLAPGNACSTVLSPRLKVAWGETATRHAALWPAALPLQSLCWELKHCLGKCYLSSRDRYQATGQLSGPYEPLASRKERKERKSNLWRVIGEDLAGLFTQQHQFLPQRDEILSDSLEEVLHPFFPLALCAVPPMLCSQSLWFSITLTSVLPPCLLLFPSHLCASACA